MKYLKRNHGSNLKGRQRKWEIINDRVDWNGIGNDSLAREWNTMTHECQCSLGDCWGEWTIDGQREIRPTANNYQYANPYQSGSQSQFIDNFIDHRTYGH